MATKETLRKYLIGSAIAGAVFGGVTSQAIEALITRDSDVVSVMGDRDNGMILVTESRGSYIPSYGRGSETTSYRLSSDVSGCRRPDFTDWSELECYSAIETGEKRSKWTR